MAITTRLLLLVTAGLLAGCLGVITGDDDGDDEDPIDARSIDAAPGTPDGTPPPPDAAHGEGEPAGLVGITLAHNQVRATVGVAPLVWDPDLAAIAQAWAESCVDVSSPIGLIDHNPNRSDTYPGYVGENIYGSSGTATGQAAVDAWAAEEANYDYESNTCSSVCGHYTQVVWATTERLGCGIHTCPGLTYGNSIVCDYSPGGNTGGRPY